MNDKFEDLLYNSGLTSQGCWDKLDEWDREAIMNFAELIVRECAEAVKNSIWHLPRGYKVSDQAEFVKKHFGVK